AEPPVAIVEEPAEPAEPPVAIVEELVPKPTESLPKILESSPPDTVAAVVIEEKTAVAVSSNSNSTTNNKPPVNIASSFSRNQLVEMCGAAGISRAGTKDALVERLILKGVFKLIDK
ncbi:MAG: SAP domain-containing protein, partial [Pseudomonadota bacterium]